MQQRVRHTEQIDSVGPWLVSYESLESWWQVGRCCEEEGIRCWKRSQVNGLFHREELEHISAPLIVPMETVSMLLTKKHNRQRTPNGDTEVWYFSDLCTLD